MDINILITQMSGLFIIIFLGYLIYKIKLVDDNFVAKLTKLILNITTPAMLLASVMKLTERQDIRTVLTALAVSLVTNFLLMPVIGFILAKILRVKKTQEGLYIFMTSYSNVGFMGFPVVEAVAGATGLFYAAIFNLSFSLAVFSIGVWFITKNNDNGTKFNPKLIISPGVIGALLAIIIYFMDIKFPVVISNTFDMLGDITPPAAMLVIGFSLAKMDIKNVFNDWRVYIWTVIRQIAIPLLLWVPLAMVVKHELLLYVSYIMMLMPVANTAVLLSNTYGGDVPLAARTTFISTLFALISVPLCVWFVI